MTTRLRTIRWFILMLACGSQGSRAGTALTTVRVASGLANPVFVTHAPGDYERLFIIEQRRGIRILKDGAVLPTPFLNVTSLLSLGMEQGLLGLAFHPDFASNRQFYINYTNTAGDTVVAMYKASVGNADLAEETGNPILFVDQPFSNHNGGWLGFGPDGYLYVALGDGGDQMDPGGRGQSITGELLGNLLRIDVDGDDFPADAARDYAIPPDNPFANGPGEDEIWAYGLRNPWRCAFDRQTGDLYVADVGQDDWEEVNFQPAQSSGGENYGWDCMEGLHCTSFGGCNCGALSSELPIHEYPNGASACSITGGEVYRGCEIPDLHGTYFFADHCDDRIWSLTYNGSTANVVERTQELAPQSPLSITSISSFGTDAAGEIYICDRTGGEVFKIVPAAGTPDLVNSDPLNDIIDARTPLGSNGVTRVGFTQVTFTFDQATNCTESTHFFVRQQGVAGPPPQVETVQPLAGNRLHVTMDRPIEPRAWTTITHGPTQSSVRLGFLPGDVNGDQFTLPSDILDLIDSLNGVAAPLPIWSGDLDRSGAILPADIVMLIDLLNGLGNLDVYNGAQLP